MKTKWRSIGVRTFIFMGLCVAVAACVMPPHHRFNEVTAQPPLPSTEVYFYPAQGQSSQQQDRDRYECYLWAVEQTGFDPSAPNLPPHQRVQMVPKQEPPPGSDSAAGAATGAVLGAILSEPGERLEGAAVGAIAGAMIGSAAEAERQARAEELERQRYGYAVINLETKARAYRRAMAACLEGRGYTVK